LTRNLVSSLQAEFDLEQHPDGFMLLLLLLRCSIATTGTQVFDDARACHAY
jgi:hypothetical protein